jgi:hypothetical protein
MDEFKEQGNKLIGVGGWYCPCCNKYHSDKKFFRRISRHKLKQKVQKEIKDDLKGE